LREFEELFGPGEGVAYVQGGGNVGFQDEPGCLVYLGDRAASCASGAGDHTVVVGVTNALVVDRVRVERCAAGRDVSLLAGRLEVRSLFELEGLLGPEAGVAYVRGGGDVGSADEPCCLVHVGGRPGPATATITVTVTVTVTVTATVTVSAPSFASAPVAVSAPVAAAAFVAGTTDRARAAAPTAVDRAVAVRLAGELVVDLVRVERHAGGCDV
jgi:hypothetical protein